MMKWSQLPVDHSGSGEGTVALWASVFSVRGLQVVGSLIAWHPLRSITSQRLVTLPYPHGSYLYGLVG